MRLIEAMAVGGVSRRHKIGHVIPWLQELDTDSARAVKYEYVGY